MRDAADVIRQRSFEIAKNRDYHVVPHSDGWAVKRENADRASSIHRTQSDAIVSGRDLARISGGELRIHGRDGKIRDSDSYGNDPAPPLDQRH